MLMESAGRPFSDVLMDISSAFPESSEAFKS